MDARDAIALWLSRGEIDEDLAARLRSTLEEREQPERDGRIIWVLASIGAVLTGAGLLLFIASQWDQSSPTRRLLLLAGIYVVTVLGAVVAERQRLGVTANGLWFLSSIAVGANVFLVGQIFNLPLTYWQGTLLWAVAAAVMGWATNTTAHGWLVLPLALLSLGWVVLPNPGFFEQGAFLFDAAGLRPLLALLGLGCVAISLLVRSTAFAWLAPAASLIGGALIAVPVVVSTFHPETFAWFFQMETRWVHLAVVLFVLGLVGAAWSREPRSPLIVATVAVTLLLLVVLPQVANPADLGDGDSVSWLARPFDRNDLLFAVHNAVVFGMAVGTIVLGHRFSSRALVNAGYGAVIVLVGAIYLGRLAGYLPTSLAVILGGLLLIGAAVFVERRRRDSLQALASTPGTAS